MHLGTDKQFPGRLKQQWMCPAASSLTARWSSGKMHTLGSRALISALHMWRARSSWPEACMPSSTQARTKGCIAICQTKFGTCSDHGKNSIFGNAVCNCEITIAATRQRRSFSCSLFCRFSRLRGLVAAVRASVTRHLSLLTRVDFHVFPRSKPAGPSMPCKAASSHLGHVCNSRYARCKTATFWMALQESTIDGNRDPTETSRG
jgi:hypothetical protein